MQPTKLIVKRPRGTLTGAFVGFLAGLVVAGSSGYWQWIDEYQRQNSVILAGLNAVEKGVEKVPSAYMSISMMLIHE